MAAVFCALFAAGSWTAGFAANAAAASAASRATHSLHALFDSTWQRELHDDPLNATYLGDTRYNDRWTDESVAAIEARHRDDVATLAALKRIPRKVLPVAEQLNYDLFEREYAQRLRVWPFKPWLYGINHQGGIQTLSEITEVLSLQTTKDYDDLLARLNGIGKLVDQNIELLRIAVAEKRTQPRVIMERIPPQIARQIVEDPEKSPFFAAFSHIPQTIAAPERERIVAAGRKAIVEVVVPAYRRLQKAFNEQYLPATRSSVGIFDTPQGAEFYRERIAYHTTSNQLTAEQIHDIGLTEVERIRAEMLTIKDKVGFKGSLLEFFTYLRSDPKFYYKTPEELFNAYAVIAKRIDPELPRLFGHLPRTPYGVRPIPDTSAPDTTTAYYQPSAADGSRAGFFYVNLYRPEVRPKYEMEVLTTHEAVPGHHLQISLAQEQTDLPMFRRNAGYTAYVEGWALYCESLGDELGLYHDPYSKFGQLTYDMWRAVRLVVDTGMHAKGWSRQQAIDFFKANAAKQEADIINEIDRYISWPGQALAYKIGQMQIRALRTEAEETLGAKFNVRAFHDQLLSTGAVPLDIMAANMHRWMAAQSAKPKPALANAAAATSAAAKP
jgi:uncharacterized protein (DUF885 family)